MKWVGVLVGDGSAYLFCFKGKIKDDDIEERIGNELGESANDFNWQVLDTGADNRDALPFRIVEVE